MWCCCSISYKEDVLSCSTPLFLTQTIKCSNILLISMSRIVIIIIYGWNIFLKRNEILTFVKETTVEFYMKSEYVKDKKGEYNYA